VKIDFLDTFINIRNNEEYTRSIEEALKSDKRKTFYYLNTHSFYLIKNNSYFKDVFNRADFIIADGIGIVWGIRLLKKIKINKVVFTYSFFDGLAEMFSENKSRLYLLGSTEYNCRNAVDGIKNKFPNIEICGFHHGFFDIESDSGKIIENINLSGCDVLIVGMGLPVSEKWINENLNKLKVKIVFSVGAFIDIAAGQKKIAPRFLYNSGFEWLYRLINEPKRLFFRYLKSNSLYLLIITKEFLLKSFNRR